MPSWVEYVITLRPLVNFVVAIGWVAAVVSLAILIAAVLFVVACVVSDYRRVVREAEAVFPELIETRTELRKERAENRNLRRLLSIPTEDVAR